MEDFYESLTILLAGIFSTGCRSGGTRCAEVTVIRDSTVYLKFAIQKEQFFRCLSTFNFHRCLPRFLTTRAKKLLAEYFSVV